MEKSKVRPQPPEPPPRPQPPKPQGTKIYPIPFPKGWHMIWAMYTQSSNEFTVILKDNSETYVNVTRAQEEPIPHLAEGASEIKGENLQLEVTISGKNFTGFKDCINTYVVFDGASNIVGYGYNLCVEDWTDNDYNDLFVTMACWR